jgi:hypothetical protein
MTQKTKEMSPSEVLERIRKLQEKESDACNQIQDVNDFFQGFLEELEESGEASDSEIEDFEDLIGKSIENQNDAEEKCEQLTSIAKKLTHLAIKIKNEINISQKNQ